MTDKNMEHRFTQLEQQLKEAIEKIAENTLVVAKSIEKMTHHEGHLKRLDSQNRDFGKRILELEKEQARRESNDKLITSINHRVWFLVLGGMASVMYLVLTATL